MSGPPSEGWSAFDVETANSYSRSVCSLGVATLVGGELVTREWLVKPPGNRYDAKNTEVHGLSAEDTRDAPAFPEVWREASELVTLSRTLAHNAEFDIGCVRAAMRHHKQKEPGFRPVGCTLRMAHLVWPDRTEPYRLETLCSEHGIAIDAHRAGSDAAATLALADILVADWGQGDLAELRAASNKGHQGRADRAIKRVAGTPPGPPSERQIGFLRDLLQERQIDPDSIIPHVRTRGQASQLLDAILERGAHPDDLVSPQALRQHAAWLERTANRILAESPAKPPPARRRPPPQAAPPTQRQPKPQGLWGRLRRFLSG